MPMRMEICLSVALTDPFNVSNTCCFSAKKCEYKRIFCRKPPPSIVSNFFGETNPKSPYNTRMK